MIFIGSVVSGDGVVEAIFGVVLVTVDGEVIIVGVDVSVELVVASLCGGDDAKVVDVGLVGVDDKVVGVAVVVEDVDVVTVVVVGVDVVGVDVVGVDVVGVDVVGVDVVGVDVVG